MLRFLLQSNLVRSLLCVFFGKKNDLYGMAVATFSECDLRNSPWIFIVIRSEIFLQMLTALRQIVAIFINLPEQ